MLALPLSILRLPSRSVLMVVILATHVGLHARPASLSPCRCVGPSLPHTKPTKRSSNLNEDDYLSPMQMCWRYPPYEVQQSAAAIKPTAIRYLKFLNVDYMKSCKHCCLSISNQPLLHKGVIVGQMLIRSTEMKRGPAVSTLISAFSKQCDTTNQAQAKSSLSRVQVHQSKQHKDKCFTFENQEQDI